MARPISLSNGSMLVGLNVYGLVHDLYYPYVGMENHANARGMRHRIGVYVEGQFSWMDDGSWKIDMKLQDRAMVGQIIAVNDNLQVVLEFTDFVDVDYNVLCRKVKVLNRTDQEREVRVFFHQVFRIADSNRGDTALYVPDENYILDYKGRRSFLIYAQKADGTSFDQYSVGIHGIEGKEGTYRDAEDGNLEGHPVEHGSVDSTIRLSCKLSNMASTEVQYWLVAAASHDDALKVHHMLLDEGLPERQSKTELEWNEWLDIATQNIKLNDEALRIPLNNSLFIIKSHIDRRGSILASGDSAMLNYARDNYSYCWPRDAAFVLWPLIRLGYTEEPRAFFEFARDVLTDRGALMHKFQPDRAVGSTWHPLIHDGKPELAIQEDETAIVLFMLHQFFQHSPDDADFVRRLYSSFIQPAANFLETFIEKSTKLPHPSYDLWEEKFLTSTYTVAVTYAGLMAASKMAEQFEYPDDAVRWQTVADDIKEAAQKTLFNPSKNYFYKGFVLNEEDNQKLEYDDTIDASSLYGAAMFGLYPIDHEHVTKSLATLETTLLNSAPIGGVPRYEGDQYCRPAQGDAHKGNPWFLTTLWLAQIYLDLHRSDEAKGLIDWTLSHMMPSGVLAEQLNPETGESISVAPLIWSSAEFVSTILDSTES